MRATVKYVCMIVSFFALASSGNAREPENKTSMAKLPFSLVRIDANNLGMWVTNEGSYAWNLNTGAGGLEYPVGSDSAAWFAAGSWLGALDADSFRVVAAEYAFEFAPGIILPNGSPDDPEDPRFRVYKIDSQSGPGDPDWDEWPIADGAPVDAFGDPLLLGEQTLWSVYNDADPLRHTVFFSAPFGVEVQHLVYAFAPDPPTA